MRETIGTGCIEFAALYYVLDAALALRDASAIRADEHEVLRSWMGELLLSLRTERYAELEWKRKNKHGLMLRLLMLALSSFVGDATTAMRTLYAFNPLLEEQTRAEEDANKTVGLFAVERTRADCRHSVAVMSHAWLLALTFSDRIGARLNRTAICQAIHENLIMHRACDANSTTLTPDEMAEIHIGELMVENGWRHTCATFSVYRVRQDLAGAYLPYTYDFSYHVPPYWNLISAV